MARIRTDFIRGTITNNPLAIGDVTLTSGSLASLPVISSPDIAVIILDPAGAAPEIVHVTAHSSASSSATILRGREGSSAKAHVQGTAFAHGATSDDLPANAFPATVANGDILYGVAATDEYAALATTNLGVLVGGATPTFNAPTTPLTFLRLNAAGTALEWGSAANLGAPLPRGLTSSSYWSTPGWSATSYGDVAFGGADQLIYIPISLGRPATFDRIGVWVTVTSGAGTGRLGICNVADDGTPGTLIVDGGTFNPAAGGRAEVAIDVSLDAGNYYLMLACSTTPTFKTWAAGGIPGATVNATQFTISTVIPIVTGAGAGAFASPPPAPNTATLGHPNNCAVQLREKVA